MNDAQSKITENQPEGQAENQDGSPEAGSPALRAADMIPGPLNPLPGPLDFSKPMRVKRGKWPVRIIAIDHSLTKPVIGVLVGSGMHLDTQVSVWHLNGQYDTCTSSDVLDLENVPETPKASASEAKPSNPSPSEVSQ